MATKTPLNAKINEVKGKIPNITNLATNTALTAVENKIPNVSKLIRINEIEKKLLIIVMINTLLPKKLIS